MIVFENLDDFLKPKKLNKGELHKWNNSPEGIKYNFSKEFFKISIDPYFTGNEKYFWVKNIYVLDDDISPTLEEDIKRWFIENTDFYVNSIKKIKGGLTINLKK